jgi:parallel beta-helix repeat protein
MRQKVIAILLLIILVVSGIGCSCNVDDGKVYFDCHGNLVPCEDSTYDLGSATLYWDDLYVDNLHTAIPVNGIVCATLVVAANNSLDTARADYICDGTADDVQIQEALDDLPAVGGKVVLLEGSYATESNITIPANTTFEGQGSSTTITASDASITNAITIDGDNICIRDMQVYLAAGCGTAGSRPNVIFANGYDRLLLMNLYLYGDKTVSDGSVTRQNGIILNNCDYSRIVNCEATNNEYNGIRLYDSNSNIVDNCLSTNNDLDGIYIDSTEHNTVTNCTTTGSGERGIQVKSSDNTTIKTALVYLTQNLEYTH